SSSSGIVQLKQPRPFSKIEMARRNQAGQRSLPHSWNEPVGQAGSAWKVHFGAWVVAAHV
ncbi:hypothetical protein, partial [Burkholderia pseudomallei]|uniref:hypothetical protein n=1 Tax=Burkholderia pseudomallei TaxID=28450 RepID=UPI001C839BE6